MKRHWDRVIVVHGHRIAQVMAEDHFGVIYGAQWSLDGPLDEVVRNKEKALKEMEDLYRNRAKLKNNSLHLS